MAGSNVKFFLTLIIFDMNSSRFFAVILWVNDKPVTGSVLNVSNIVEPRKNFIDYYVGEKVKAKCPGHGVHDGVIGKISTSYKKKELEDILRSDEEFALLVERHVSPVVEPTTATDTPTKKTKKSSVTTKKADKVKQKRKSTVTSKEDSIPTKSQKNLESLAKELELTELQDEIDTFNDSTEGLPVSEVYKKSMTVLHDTDSPAAQLSKQFIQNLQNSCNCKELQNRVDTLTTEVFTLRQQMSSAQFMLDTLWTHYQSIPMQSYPVPFNTGPSTIVPASTWSMQSTMPSSSTPVPSTPMPSTPMPSTPTPMPSTPVPSTPVPSTAMPSTPMPSTPMPSTPMPSTPTPMPSTPVPSTPMPFSPLPAPMPPTLVPSTPLPLTSEAVSSPESSDSQITQPGQFFNNYSREILEAKASKLKDFSKVAKLLLRLLYTEDERKGRSVTGSASNGKYEAKPALQHPERLQVIYDIIEKRWPGVKRPAINAKFAEALKPSVTKQ